MTVTTSRPSVEDIAPAPVRLRLRLPALVDAGVGVLLEPYPTRVTVLGGDSTTSAQVEVFDPLTHGFEAQRADRDHIPLVALVPDRSHAAVARARELGATRVLPHSVGVVELLATLEAAHRAGSSGPRAPADPLADLSQREAEIVAQICRGLSNTEIARELYLSINSVKTYIRTAYRKIGVNSRSQAVIWGLGHGL